VGAASSRCRHSHHFSNLLLLHFFQPLLRNYIINPRALYRFSSYELSIGILSLLNAIIHKHKVTTASRHFSCWYLKANKISKSELKGQGKLNRHIISESILALCAKNYQN